MRDLLLRLVWGALLVFVIAPGIHAQENQQQWQSLYELYGGCGLLSNSPNGVKGARQPLNGFEAELAMLRWHGLRFKVATSDYRGTNLNAQEHLLFLTGGGEYDHRLGPREVGFLEGLMGNVAMNKNWMQNGAAGQTTSFLGIVGGGLDTPIGHHLAIRVKGDALYMNLHPALSTVVQYPAYPNTVHGLPNFYARVGAGLVWYF